MGRDHVRSDGMVLREAVDADEAERTTIGVGALELAREAADGSPYIVSRNICADITCASLGSEAATVACRLVVVFGSSI